ncbi:hypothetical protein KI811_08230 [Geobacter hydrogenophilus]|uniref:Uncharacterized protein n=1 Tax=Geobacter hydrogenophilus TaxID=40983 RepID=A0A9W6FZ84_9BACT|nr:hypothetical protein [Geobacter hydrogenophilus]MBT0893798.1 hypothetical protein [Geobacter hydrogenophilus]GLI37503.1 hypothetical protein GHYDROH2_10040 [Geobacter hydrogenophilus]
MIIDFELQNRRFVNKIQKSSSSRTLIFGGTVIDKILVIDKGYLLSGTVRLHENDSFDEPASIHYFETELEGVKSNRFQVEACIPQATFQHLLSIDEERIKVNISLDFGLTNPSLRFSITNPYSNEIEWNVVNSNVELAESIGIATYTHQ